VIEVGICYMGFSVGGSGGSFDEPGDVDATERRKKLRTLGVIGKKVT